MKIPKYIENALKRRVRAAVTLSEMDSLISRFIDDNCIEVEECDYRTGVEMYANPWDSADRIRRSIRAKERKHNETD